MPVEIGLLDMTAQQYASAYENGGYRQTLSRLKRQGLAHDEAENLAQTAWLRGLVRLRQLRHDERLSAWITAIAMNQLRTARRTRRPDQLREANREPGMPGITIIGVDLWRAMERCCSARQKRLLALVYFDGFSGVEAAKKLGMPAGAVHQELTRARAAMKKYLGSAQERIAV
jgi:RNA polymerase sigma factor (sigma-70 family)